MRVFAGSLSPPYFFLNIIPFVERIMLRRFPPFHLNLPSHNFFRNFLAKSFVVSIIFVTFAVSYLAESSRWAKAGWTYVHKGVTVRFGFDNLRISQIHNYLSRTKQRGRPIGMYCHIYPPISIRPIVFCWERGFYIHSPTWGFCSLLVSTDRAMREPSDCGTGDRAGSTFLFVYDII